MTETQYRRERRLLQIMVFFGAFVPICAGGSGMIWGPAMIFPVMDPALDSHFRYLSGLLCAIGFGFWSAIPAVETKTERARVLTALVVLGGLARLGGAIFAVMPPAPMLTALVMELAVTPLLCLWQARIARYAKAVPAA
jgi:hypothetical protein